MAVLWAWSKYSTFSLLVDDLVLIAETCIKLQRLLNQLGRYCDKNHLRVNLEKTNIMVFRQDMASINLKEVLKLSLQGKETRMQKE